VDISLDDFGPVLAGGTPSYETAPARIP